LKTTAPTELASNSVYTPGALKRVVKEYSAKDVRKHVEALSKRVEKHFTEASEKETTQKSGIARGTVMVGVWKACETEVVKMTELFTKLISQCYGKSGVSLDYTVADVQAVFRNNRVGT
jgi:exocyst complex component 1